MSTANFNSNQLGLPDMEIYTEKIGAARDFDDLCNIVEEAADDERITNEDYCAVYTLCVNRAREL